MVGIVLWPHSGSAQICTLRSQLPPDLDNLCCDTWPPGSPWSNYPLWTGTAGYSAGHPVSLVALAFFTFQPCALQMDYYASADRAEISKRTISLRQEPRIIHSLWTLLCVWDISFKNLHQPLTQNFHDGDFMKPDNWLGREVKSFKKNPCAYLHSVSNYIPELCLCICMPETLCLVYLFITHA